MTGYFVKVYEIDTNVHLYDTVIYRKPVKGNDLFGRKIIMAVPLLFKDNYEVYVDKLW